MRGDARRTRHAQREDEDCDGEWQLDGDQILPPHIRARILSLPDQLAARVSRMTDQETVRRLMDREIRKAMRGWMWVVSS